MKMIKTLVLASLMTIVPVRQSNAAVSAVLAIAGTGGAGAVALAGLGSVGVGFLATMNSSSCDGGGCLVGFLLGATVGAILLDNETGKFEFKKLDLDNAKSLGLNAREMEIYNSEIEEVNLVFEEVSSQLSNESTIEESEALWSEYQDYLSSESFEVMKKLATK